MYKRHVAKNRKRGEIVYIKAWMSPTYLHIDDTKVLNDIHQEDLGFVACTLTEEALSLWKDGNPTIRRCLEACHYRMTGYEYFSVPLCLEYV